MDLIGIIVPIKECSKVNSNYVDPFIRTRELIWLPVFLAFLTEALHCFKRFTLCGLALVFGVRVKVHDRKFSAGIVSPLSNRRLDGVGFLEAHEFHRPRHAI